MDKKTRNKKFERVAQVTLELTVSIIGTMLIIGAIAAIFVWVNNNLVYRQERYEEQGISSDKMGRERAGRYNAINYTNGPEVQVNEWSIKGAKLDIFNESTE